MAIETVLSPLLSDTPAVMPTPTPAVRAVDPDYADTEAAGYIESDEAFAVRIGIPQIGALAALAGVVSIRLLMWGHRTWRTA